MTKVDCGYRETGLWVIVELQCGVLRSWEVRHPHVFSETGHMRILLCVLECRPRSLFPASHSFWLSVLGHPVLKV